MSKYMSKFMSNILANILVNFPNETDWKKAEHQSRIQVKYRLKL